MNNSVPEGWEHRRLGEILKFRRGTTYAASELSEDASSYPLYITMKSFRVGGGYSARGDKFYSPSYVRKQTLKNDEILLANTDVTSSCDILGAPLLLPPDKLRADVLFSHHVTAAKLGDDLDKDFLFYLLCSSSARQAIKSCGRGTTVKMLDMKDIEKLRFSVPSLPEQKKIASILTSVDEVIENTQKQIDKLQDLKKATMNELLTKGIGHTDFKDSELGRIPKSWAISNVGKLAEFVTSGSRGWSQYYSSEGSLFIRIGNLTRDHVNLKFDDIQLVEPPSGGEGTRTKVKLGDILVSITADLGVIGVVNENLGEAYVNQHVCLIRLEPAKDINPRWVAHFLSGHAGQKQFEKKNDGGAKAGLNLPTVRSVLVPLPSLSEQNQAVRFLDKLDSDIVMKQNKHEKHKALKKSLMQDLLTGKVRVSVD